MRVVEVNGDFYRDIRRMMTALDRVAAEALDPCRCIANGRLRHMLIGYARVSKTDGSQSLDLQRDALRAEGVDAGHVYHDFASECLDRDAWGAPA